MPTIKKEEKDTVIFVSKEDHASPSKINLPEPEPSPGLILPNGEINWNCPCLGGMATGPCGLEFRDAFSCFHYSDADPKGSDCYEAFKTMQSCMSEYPSLYGNKETDIDEMDLEDESQSSINDQKTSKSNTMEDNSSIDKNIEKQKAPSNDEQLSVERISINK